MPLVVFILDLF